MRPTPDAHALNEIFRVSRELRPRESFKEEMNELLVTDDEKAAEQALLAMMYPGLYERVLQLREMAYAFGIQWLPTLRFQEVAEFEQRHEVTLPDDYRLFLLCIGNGCSGCSYDINPLGTSHFADPVGIAWQTLERIHTPFPSNGDRSWGLSMSWEDDHDEEEWGQTWEEFTNTYPEIAESEALDVATRGTLNLCGSHITECFFLVVTGPDSDGVWSSKSTYVGDGSWSISIEPETDFLSWFEKWLHEDLD